MRVRITASPYGNIKKGEIGEVLGQKFQGTRYHVYRVQLKDGRESLFYPDELKVLS